MQFLVAILSLFGAVAVAAANSSLSEMAAIDNFSIRLDGVSNESIEVVAFRLSANKTLSCEASKIGKWPSKIYPCNSTEYTFSILDFNVSPVVGLYHDLGDGQAHFLVHFRPASW